MKTTSAAIIALAATTITKYYNCTNNCQNNCYNIVSTTTATVAFTILLQQLLHMKLIITNK